MSDSRKPRGRRVDVEVSPDLISTATRADSSHCMIADAVKLAVPDATGISVDLQTIRFSDRKRRLRYVYLTPRIAQLALVEFDAGEKPKPFTFRLDRAHVIAMRKPVSVVPRAAASPARRQALEKARASQAGGPAPLSSGMAIRRTGNIPDRIGGVAPPLGALPGGDLRAKKSNRKSATTPASQRRQFGLRALERRKPQEGSA